MKLVDDQGAIVEQYEYDPFGKQSVYDGTGNALGGSAYGVVYGFQGRRHDAETGLMYFRNRYYDPHLGRFLTVDPIGVWGDAGNWGNGMGFAWSSPLTINDPQGNQGGVGHHIVPRELFKGGGQGFSKAAQEVFEKATTGPLPKGSHYNDTAHRKYTKAVKKLIEDKLKKWKKDKGALTKNEAKKLVRIVKGSKIPAIRGFLDKFIKIYQGGKTARHAIKIGKKITHVGKGCVRVLKKSGKVLKWVKLGGKVVGKVGGKVLIILPIAGTILDVCRGKNVFKSLFHSFIW